MNNELQLIYEIMNEVGLAADSYGEIIDQDTFNKIGIGGKTLKIDLNGGYIKIDKRKEMIFNPILDIKQMQMLFKYYLDKLNELGELNQVVNYAPRINPVNGKVHIDMTMTKPFNELDQYYKIPIKKDEDIQTIRSKEYSLHTLGYVELIFRLSNKYVDLIPYDVVKESGR